MSTTMSFKMCTINTILILTMFATNLLSLYHLSTTTNFLKPKHPIKQPPQVPTHLLHQLHTIRATITRLTRLHSPSRAHTAPLPPSDLVTLSRVSAIPTSCHEHPEMLHQYMNYTAFSLCPYDGQLAESLILRGCHPLPRRRCFSRTAVNPRLSDLDSVVIWRNYPSVTCRSFNCLKPKFVLNHPNHKQEFMVYKSNLDLTIPQLFDIAKKSKSNLRLGIDIGGGFGNFAAKMQEKNVTVLTTTMNLGVPYSEVNAIRGVVAMHAPLQQPLPVYDGVVDLVRCGHAVNRWIPKIMLEFLLYDIDRVLRGGGFLWIDRFFSKGVDLETVYKPLLFKLGYKIVKWATENKIDSKRGKNNEVYLTVLLQKPQFR
ncbi:putative methyltransferase At1g29790 [Silene latifolia]|uniref:putative methyltransferase At1g29790 n=1 Tax=Silene latifolia TaxID=37657 RepID=UPI003D77AB38